MAEEISNDQKMKSFILALLDEFYPECGDIDGGTFQDLAEKHGVLIPEIRHEPCGEFCNCAQLCYDEEWQEGVTCYRAAEWLRAVEQCVQRTGWQCPPPCNRWHGSDIKACVVCNSPRR